MATKPAVLDRSFQYTSRKLTKEGNVLSTTVEKALAFLDPMTPEEIICRYALREMALDKNSKRVATGAPASRIYQNTNLPPEVASMLHSVKEAIVAAIPEMAPPAPKAAKAAPVQPLEDAVAATLATPPAKVETKAPKAPATKPAKVETIEAPKDGGTSTVRPPPPAREFTTDKAAPGKLANGTTTSLDKAALKAAHEARKAAKV